MDTFDLVPWEEVACQETQVCTCLAAKFHGHRYLFSTINLPDIDAKLSLFGGGHTAQVSLYQLIDYIKETGLVISYVARCTEISDPCVMWKVSPLMVHTTPVSIGILRFSTNFFFFTLQCQQTLHKIIITILINCHFCLFIFLFFIFLI